VDAKKVKSNTFEMEWPPRSGKKQTFPEIDRAEWKSLKEASAKSVRGQAELFGRLAAHLNLLAEPAQPEEPAQQQLL
jgi:predicted NUDIX family NTP pyrophosphohydrolase